MDAYMMFLVSIYDENNEVYTALGLTIEDGQAIIGEVCSKMQIEPLSRQTDKGLFSFSTYIWDINFNVGESF